MANWWSPPEDVLRTFGSGLWSALGPTQPRRGGHEASRPFRARQSSGPGSEDPASASTATTSGTQATGGGGHHAEDEGSHRPPPQVDQRVVGSAADVAPRPSPGPTPGCAHCVVGCHRAVDSAIGVPSRAPSESRNVESVTPAEVRRNPSELSPGDQGVDVVSEDRSGRNALVGGVSSLGPPHRAPRFADALCAGQFPKPTNPGRCGCTSAARTRRTSPSRL